MAAGWKVKYESRAVAWTEAPETLDSLFKQRYRWSRGILQAVRKHRSRLAPPGPRRPPAGLPAGQPAGRAHAPLAARTTGTGRARLGLPLGAGVRGGDLAGDERVRDLL